MQPLSKLDLSQVIRAAFNPESGSLKMTNTSSLIPNEYDEILLSYTGDNVTGVVYKMGGNTVATLTLSYSGNNLTSVVRT